MLSINSFCDLPITYKPTSIRVKWADRQWERSQAKELRREVFCIEQGLFENDDTDSVDAQSQTIVAVSQLGAMPDQVIGTVRIHTTEPGIWWGSRLAVTKSLRNRAGIGATLIRLAVSSAHARGCNIFLAHVQSQNRPLFERLQWKSLQKMVIHGIEHDLMQANLQEYPACYDPIGGFSVPIKGAV